MKISCIYIFIISQIYQQGLQLTPQDSESRSIISLDGLWNFYLNEEGSQNGTLSGNDNDLDLFLMPVPSSYNDILTTNEGRDYLGPVTYERSFFLLNNWITDSDTVWIRFGSVCYNATVFINGQLAATHHFGHLPFSANISSLIKKDENSIKVIVDNTLSLSTIPQGIIKKNVLGIPSNSYTFSFFDYAGIDRSVILYKTPNTYVEDITLITNIKGTTGILDFNITIDGHLGGYLVVYVKDKDGSIVYSNRADFNGTIEIPNVNLWWPYLMSDTPAYLYTFEAQILDHGTPTDTYSQPFGFRELSWSETNFLINGKPIYFRGFSRHEDSDFRGKGLDFPLILRDHNLIRWIGANSYRTSNYPYSDEVMDLADQLGIMIIDESPAVNLINLTYPGILENHKQVLGELFKRDKNRPSVVMWSIAADPAYGLDNEEEYFREITAFAKTLDSTRPITLPTNKNYYRGDNVMQFVDILSLNKYLAWSEFAGDWDIIVPDIVKNITDWYTLHKKPILVTEYGCDTQEGYHALPEYLWSEEYQSQLYAQHFEAFDNLRESGWFIGEMMNNFADFKSQQTIYAVGGSKKGIFTRQRQPKSSAFVVRRRYWHLAQELNNATIPTDLDLYSTKINKMKTQIKDEL